MISQLRSFLAGCGCLFGAWSALAQAPPTNFDIGILPKAGSIMISQTTNAVFVTITNYTSFTNLTVTGMFATQTNIVFNDRGQPPDLAQTNGTFSGNVIAPKVTVAMTQSLKLTIKGDLIDPIADPDLGTITNLITTNLVDYFIVPRPANDNFSNAFKVASLEGIAIGTNDFASLETGEPKHANVATVAASVWWKWASGVNTNVLVDLAGSSFDPVVAVYTGETVTNLSVVGFSTNDPIRRLKAHVNFDAVAGMTYRIAVSGYDNSTNSIGDIRLRIAPGAVPDTNGPIVSITNPASESLVTTNQVIFTGTAKEQNSNESGISRVILQVNNPTNIFQASGTTDWAGIVDLPPGTNLVLAIAIDYAGNASRRPAAVVVRYLNPTNDLFANAIELVGVGGQVTAITGRATREPGEPLHAGNAGAHSIWYQWRAPFTGDLTLTTEGSSFDTVLALYIGSSINGLVEIASSDDAFTDSGFSSLQAHVIANQLYYIAVDGFGGDSGDVLLSYNFATSGNLFGVFISPALGGFVSPPSNLYSDNTLVLLTAVPDVNYEFVSWNDSSGTFGSSENPLSLIVNRNYFLEAKFRVKNFSDTFRSGDLKKLPWSTSGNAPWLVESSGGQFTARSGPIGDSQFSSLALVTNLFAGAGSFDLRVSSEEGWDWLEFYVNGQRLGRWSGEVDWQSFTFSVLQGLNRLEWRYVKDANFSAGLDAAFIDNVYVPLDKPNAASTNSVLSITRLIGGKAQLSLQAQPNVSYVFQASSNLFDWVPVHTNSTPGITLQFIDADSSKSPRRFYRAFAR